MCMGMSPKGNVICVWIYVSKRQGYMCMGMSPKGKVICVWVCLQKARLYVYGQAI